VRKENNTNDDKHERLASYRVKEKTMSSFGSSQKRVENQVKNQMIKESWL